MSEIAGNGHINRWRWTIVVALVMVMGCAGKAVDDEPALSGESAGEYDEVETVRNVVLVIGDGMGPQQIGLLQQYARNAPNSIYEGAPTAWEELAREGVMGLAATEAEGALTVDSACSATHLATGKPAALEAIGTDANGERAPTILEIAHQRGKATGLISDTRITHATPASFAAHTTHRSRENDIAAQLIDGSVDLLLSGGLRHFLPQSVNGDADEARRIEQLVGPGFEIASARDDDEDLLAQAEAAGYELVFDKDQLMAADSEQVLGLFSSSAMLNAIAERRSRDDGDRRQPSLAQMTGAALERLDRREEGFFLMIESGQIDWAGHDNDAGTLLHELLAMDETLSTLRQWAQGRDDTLIVVAADHETGGFGFSYSAADLPEAAPLSGSVFNGDDHRPNYNFGSVDTLDRLFAQRRSFPEILARFYAGEDQSPAALQRQVNEATAFPIDAAGAQEVLQDRENPYYDESHPYMKADHVPAVRDFSAFYVYGEESRRNLLGRAMATEQNVVWSTGTHTHTPVPVVAWGPAAVTAPFDRYLHLVDVGQLMIDALGE